jgi:hypothetical protein
LALLAGCLDEAAKVTDALVTAIAGEAIPATVASRRYESALVE